MRRKVRPVQNCTTASTNDFNMISTFNHLLMQWMSAAVVTFLLNAKSISILLTSLSAALHYHSLPPRSNPWIFKLARLTFFAWSTRYCTTCSGRPSQRIWLCTVLHLPRPSNGWFDDELMKETGKQNWRFISPDHTYIYIYTYIYIF